MRCLMRCLIRCAGVGWVGATGDEQSLKEYAKKASLNTKDIKALIEDVLHNPDFNADEVDTVMLLTSS